MRLKPSWTRRRILQAGSLALPGLTLPTFLLQKASAENVSGAQGILPGFGQAKRCIFLFMWGGPSHLDTFDPKPEAASEVRGEFKPIETCVPGLQITEHFRHMPSRMDRCAVIRSLGHDDPAHLSSAHTTMTGHLPPVNKSDAEPPSDRDTPHIGSVLAKLTTPPQGLPGFVSMPWLAYHPAAPGGKAPGQNGGWLGHRYDPLLITGDLADLNWEVPALKLIDGLSSERLSHREQLLEQLELHQHALKKSAPATAVTSFQDQAMTLLNSARVRQAFNLQAEPDEVRDRYGRNTHGQCVLLARRLVENGVPLVSVNWHNDGQNFWDTHGNNFNRLKNDLIPPADQALAALLDDLQDRGLLQETLVVWVGEFGRRPQITQGNAGREHWPFCYSGLLAGAGINGGSIYGASDNIGAYPQDLPVTPHDLMATVMHSLGIPAEATLPDRVGRPHSLYGGSPILPLWG